MTPVRNGLTPNLQIGGGNMLSSYASRLQYLIALA